VEGEIRGRFGRGCYFRIIVLEVIRRKLRRRFLIGLVV